MMRFVRVGCRALLGVALTLYAFDCFAAPTSDEAMQCCDSMPCPERSHGSSRDCCQAMAGLHAPFVQTHSPNVSMHALSGHAMLPTADASSALDSHAHHSVSLHSHAPPLMTSAASVPLRI